MEYEKTKMIFVPKEQKPVCSMHIAAILKQALNSGDIQNVEIQSIHIQIMQLLKDLILKFTKGESTSTTLNTAERLLGSIFYAVDACLKNMKSTEDAVYALKTQGIKKIYGMGIENLRTEVSKSYKLYNEIKRDRLHIPLEAYNDTIGEEGIQIFFEKYDVVFSAQDVMASIDYPLTFDDMRVQGILYIKNYLEHLKTETEFCKFFDDEDIIKVLNGYGKIYATDYKVEIINIFEIVMNNCIFSVLSGESARNIIISKYQFSVLEKKLSNLNFYKAKCFTDEAVRKIIEELSIKDECLQNYICCYKKVFIQRLLNVCRCGKLLKLVPIDYETARNITIAFQEGERMTDSSFEKFIERMLNTDDTKEKINAIKTDIHSLGDLIDVLESDCLFGNEYYELFESLDYDVLSLLCRAVLFEEIRDGSFDFVNVHAEDKEKEWQIAFVKFMQKLNSCNINEIKKYILN